MWSNPQFLRVSEILEYLWLILLGYMFGGIDKIFLIIGYKVKQMSTD